jgi:hypothetical protein
MAFEGLHVCDQEEKLKDIEEGALNAGGTTTDSIKGFGAFGSVERRLKSQKRRW